jgi:hypothetical protein
MRLLCLSYIVHWLFTVSINYSHKSHSHRLYIAFCYQPWKLTNYIKLVLIFELNKIDSWTGLVPAFAWECSDHGLDCSRFTACPFLEPLIKLELKSWSLFIKFSVYMVNVYAKNWREIAECHFQKINYMPIGNSILEFKLFFTLQYSCLVFCWDK